MVPFDEGVQDSGIDPRHDEILRPITVAHPSG